MRARLLHSWPALSFHFGIHPWDLDRLSPFELDAYIGALDDINEGR